MSVPQQHMTLLRAVPIKGIVHFGHACNVRPFGWHASQCPHGFVTPNRARLYHYYTCVVVVHSYLCQALIKREWGASLADVGLGCHRVKAPQKSQTPHSVLRTKSCGLGFPKRTNSLQDVEQNPPPQILDHFKKEK